MARKGKFDYFDAFLQISNYAVQYADELVAFFNEHFDEEKGIGKVSSTMVLEKFNDLHAIEESADEVLQDISDSLAVEFIAPIAPEDIIGLAEELDTVVDELDDVLQRIYMNNVEIITPEMLEMINIVKRATEAVHNACEKFSNFKKTKSIKKYIKEINAIEDEGDKVYIESMHNIYKRAEEGDFHHPLVAVGMYGVLSALEKCCDACECTGDIMRTIRLKNS